MRRRAIQIHVYFTCDIWHRQVVSESTKKGNVIARVRATDADAGANAILTYSLEGDQDEMFSISPNTGEIRLEKIRMESSSNEVGKEIVHHLVVLAIDGGLLIFRVILLPFIGLSSAPTSRYIISFKGLTGNQHRVM